MVERCPEKAGVGSSILPLGIFFTEPPTGMPSSLDRAAWNIFAKHNAFYHIFSHPSLLHHTPENIRDFWLSGDTQIRELKKFGRLSGTADVAVDFGCGVGRLTRALRAVSKEQIGVDISDEMIRQARELNEAYPSIQFRRIEGDRWPVETGSVSLVVSLFVFNHLSSIALMERSILEIGRILKKGGKAIFGLQTTSFKGRLLSSVRNHLRRDTKAPSSTAEIERRLLAGDGVTEEQIMTDMFELECRKLKSLPLPVLRRALETAGLKVYNLDRKSGSGSTLVAAEKKV